MTHDSQPTGVDGDDGTYKGHKRLSATEVGLNAPRSCTNVCCIGVLVLFWILLIVVAAAAFSKGDLKRLYNGVDYAGNICSKNDASITFPAGQNYNDPNASGYVAQGPSVGWSDRTLLWYPIYFSHLEFHVHDVKDLGVCVSACPAKDSRVAIYLNADVNGTAATGGPMSDYYNVLYDSKPRFNRCIPDVASFDCEGLADIADRTVCLRLRNTTSTAIDFFYSASENMFSELANSWWIILVCVILAIVLSTVWIFILRRLVVPVVVLSIILAVLAVIGAGVFLAWRWYVLKDTNSSDTAKFYLAAAILCWIGAVVLVGVVIFLCKDILIACNIIEEGAKIPIAIPTMITVPIFTAISILPFAMWALFIAACTYTAADKISVTAPAPEIGNSFSNSTLLRTEKFELAYWRIYANLYNLFMFLWMMGLMGAIGFMVTAFCAVFWYWSKPGDDKDPQGGVLAGLKLTFRYHFGTVALGSFLIAVLQFLRILMTMFEKRMKKVVGENTCFKFVVCLCQCCLACTERILKFISKNIYVMCAITGEGFKDAGLHALGLLGRNLFSAGAVSILSEYVTFFSKAFLTATVSVIGFAIYTSARGEQGHANMVLVMVIIVGIVFVIVSTFIGLLGVCVNAVLLSYCYDLEINDGASKPFFMPGDLAKFLDEHKDRKMAQDKANRAEANAAVTPLVEQ